jgi:hypothetical protein
MDLRVGNVGTARYLDGSVKDVKDVGMLEVDCDDEEAAFKEPGTDIGIR